MKFGELKRLSPREIWKNEATEFTPWLAENVDELGKALGLELELKAREAGVGGFSLDLLASDLGSNRLVTIENQLESTDHDHLGKLLTYAAGFDAAIVIWVASSIRDEHRQALEWLNQKTDEETAFFGVVVEVIQIDEGKPALNFNPVVIPNEWQKVRRGTGRASQSAKGEAYRAFFQVLIDDLREKHRFTNARLGQAQNWYSFASGVPGFKVTYGVNFCLGNRARAEVYIDHGDGEKNKKLFDLLLAERDGVEKEFGGELSWERMDDRQASRIAVYRSGAIEDDDESLSGIRDWMIDNLLLLKKVFQSRLKRLVKRVN
ncbi:MAG: DUF4268 domain-containing protein [Candidatus Thiodiazotropha sp.]